MFSDAYTKIAANQCGDLINQLNLLVEGSPYNPKNLRILAHHLPFYKGYSLFEITDASVNPERSVSLIGRDDFKNTSLYLLNGTNEAIYSLNTAVPVSLNEKNIRTYVMFFFAYVYGRFGKFKIIEHVDDIIWREQPSSAGRKALSKMIEPLKIKSHTQENDFVLSASIIFKDTLFESNIQIAADGKINLTNQEMLVEDIPVLEEVLN